jgi:hypothetical protein
MDKKFFVGMAVLLSVSLFFTGCSTDSDDESDGGDNSSGGETPTVVTDFALADSFDAPVAGETPDTTFTGTQYNGAVAWTHGENTALSGNFQETVIYTATVTLTANTGYTFTGIEGTFAYTGATSVTPGANSGTAIVVTVVFPVTKTAAQLLKDELGSNDTNVTIESNGTTVTVSGAVTLSTAATVRDSVTLAIASGAGELTVAGTATVDANGVVNLPEGGSFATSGTGTVVFGKTTFGGVGTWTASATGGSAQTGVSGVSITSSANGAAVALVAGSGERTAGILTASENSLSITQTIGESNAFSIGAGAVVDITGGSLVLTAGTGPATFTGTGKVVAGATEFVGGTGGWSAVGASNTVTIAATSDVLSSVTAATATGIVAGTGASVTQKAGNGNALDIAVNTTIDLGTSSGGLVLTAGTDPATFTGTGKVVAGATEFVGGTGGWSAVGDSGTVTIAATSDALSSVTADTATGIVAGDGASVTQLAVESNALEIAANTAVDLGLSDGLVLTGDGSNGAKLTGTGKVVAAQTEIVGGTGGWTAVGASSTVTIAATDANASSITAATNGVLTAGATATITQLAGANNNLTIAAGTTIALGNNEEAKLGEIVLTGASSNPGMLTLTDNTSTITTGIEATSGYSTAVAVSNNGASTASEATFTAVGLENLVGDGTYALAKTNVTPSGGNVAAGKLVELVGTAGNAGTVKGGGDAEDGSISAVTETAAVS